MDEVEKRWQELTPLIIQCEDTLPVSRRKEVGTIVKDHYLGGPGKVFSEATFPQFTKVTRFNFHVETAGLF